MKLPAPPKRMLTKDEAASYCGFPTTSRFESAAFPHVIPVNYGNCVRYDRVRLDEWLDTLSQSQPSEAMGFVEALKHAGSHRGR